MAKRKVRRNIRHQKSRNIASFTRANIGRIPTGGKIQLTPDQIKIREHRKRMKALGFSDEDII